MIKKNKKDVINFLIAILLILILSFSNKIFFNNSETSLCNENYYSLFIDYSNLVHEINFDALQIFPEIENIRCTNSITNINVKGNDIISVNYGISYIFLIAQLILFLAIAVFFYKLFKFKINKILYFLNIFLFFQLYGLPTHLVLLKIIKFNLHLIPLIIIFYVYKYPNEDKLQNKFIYDYLKFYLINFCIFIFLTHIDNFYFKNYLIHFSSWNINYSTGFNRRGFIGEIIKLINPSEIIFTTSVLISFFFGLVFYNIYKIFKHSNQNYLSILILISPFFIRFIFNDFPGGNFKEIIGIASFTCLIAYNLFQKKIYLGLSYILFTIGIFSHPVNFFVLPFIIFYLYNHFIAKRIKLFLGFLVSIGIYIFCFINFNNLFKFNENIWCSELINKFNLNLTCEVLASPYNFEFKINSSIYENIKYTQSFIDIGFFFGYLILFMFGIWTITTSKYFINNKIYFFLIFISFLPLFFLGIDWGRWLYIFFFCIFTLHLADHKNNKKTTMSKNKFLTLSVLNLLIVAPHFITEFEFLDFTIIEILDKNIFEIIQNIYKFN